MEYLIDTQILIWFQLADKKLPNNILEILVDSDNTIFVSDLSLFEISIKKKIGKLPELGISISTIIDLLKNDDFQILPISSNHISFYEKIPLIQEHRDPFDRLLLATSLFEDIPIISSDEKFKNYINQVNIIFPY